MNMHATATYRIEPCRGCSGQCPHALPAPEGFTRSIDAAVAASGWPVFLNDACAPRPPRHHEQFRIAVACCANGCSRPHIADIGLIFSQRPAVPESCSGCGACIAACPDKALAPGPDGAPSLDHSRCLACGKCIAACPEGAMTVAESGCRFMVGGKLGRRPRLATELPGLLDPRLLPGRVSGWLEVFIAGYEPGLRFGDLVGRMGLERVLALSLEYTSFFAATNKNSEGGSAA
ncbi:4Fe-4S dicluster domain-containing protein [Oceanidesulfovibrio marinus]|uniref:(Fe-S)-binding protein n=1 Tax=Oceanidesulfovibrio marinus TaxID=370038 RepID=A0A6P1ZBJ0_9BACT|nr:4Fe-4S binding protein [Oceanidesulfovibrio marinus]QJT10995.1 4Fe-4S dicluster domain-containing protein [Oceanidesulfovibrio marinus]TVM31386.1 (Fe-S)-binding protein [Oceanidesulfovibrio marinus]